MDDRIAISRIKQGDLNGLETLVMRYQASAVHASYLIVSDRAAAEDVVQAAFVKMVERVYYRISCAGRFDQRLDQQSLLEIAESLK